MTFSRIVGKGTYSGDGYIVKIYDADTLNKALLFPQYIFQTGDVLVNENTIYMVLKNNKTEKLNQKPFENTLINLMMLCENNDIEKVIIPFDTNFFDANYEDIICGTIVKICYDQPVDIILRRVL